MTTEASNSWLERAEARVGRWLAAGIGPRWVVAVSGGGDSVGLLRILHALASRLGLQLSVAHLNHGARGEAAAADAAFVANLARSLFLPIDLNHWQAPRSAHFEADARRERYHWLTEVARTRGAAAVAVGHTRDDQAETILHRILRGTGPRGLAGMHLQRPLADPIVLLRPLLHATRQEVRDHLAAIGQDFRDDSTNTSLAQTRARLRHDLLPKLADEYNPAVADALVRLGKLAGAAHRSLEGRILEIERQVTDWVNHDTASLKRPALVEYPAFLRAEVLRRVWRRAGWPESGMSAERWRRLAGLARRSKGRISVGGGIDAVCSSNYLVLERSGRPSQQASELLKIALDLPGSVPWPGGRVTTTFNGDEPRDETIDLDSVMPPLWVQGPMAGDRFSPLGMDQCEISLNDFFRGRHVPRSERVKVPLVWDQLGIVWVVGHRIAHRVRITETTLRKLGLRWEPNAGSEPSIGTSCD
jgi:tRNA(Ile)-lysidine synthase